MIIDSHAHLTSNEIYPIIDEVIARALEANVSQMINICTDLKTLERGIELAERHPFIHNVGATTPHDVEEEGELAFPHFAKAGRAGQLVAIGETGLDYHYEHSPKKLQQYYLEKYLALAADLSLPVVIHCRDAFDDLFTIAAGVPKLLLHCFTGGNDEARRAIEQGWMISISGIATFKRSDELRDVIREVPLSHLVVETDAPYLAPQTKRGKQNEPTYITETVECVARVKDLSFDEVAYATSQNTKTFFQLNH